MLRVHTQISSMLLITPRVSCCLLSISRCPPPSVERQGGIISPRARPQGRLSDIFVKFAQRRQIASRSLDLNRLKIPSSLFHGSLSRLIIKQAAPKSRLQACEKRAFGQTCNVHDGRKACNWPLPQCSFNTVPGSSPKATKSRMPFRPRHPPYPNHACRPLSPFHLLPQLLLSAPQTLLQQSKEGVLGQNNNIIDSSEELQSTTAASRRLRVPATRPLYPEWPPAAPSPTDF